MKYDNIVLHIPHSSLCFPVQDYNNKYWRTNSFLAEEDMWELTDIHADKIFDTKIKNVKSLIFPYNRFYCDVERLVDDPLEKIGQGIIYTKYKNTFLRYVDDKEKETIMGIYYEHIENLKSMIKENTLLIDCHTYEDYESDIDICIGYNEDWSKPHKWVIDLIKKECRIRGLKVGINTPFANSISPVKEGVNYHSIMIEINKHVYMEGSRITVDFNECLLNKFLKYLYKKILTHEN